MPTVLGGGDFERIQIATENALLNHDISDQRTPDQVLFRFFKPGNNQQSSPSMNVDGSSTPVLFEVGFPYQWLLSRINLIINDTTMTSIKFGGITALTNGLILQVLDESDNELQDFLDGQTIQANRDWVPLAGVDVQFNFAAGVDLLAVRWTVARAGAPMLIPANGVVRITVQDDLEAIDFFEVMAQGVRPGA